MATIYLIRHGQASFGQENYDQLSDLGEKQASLLGLRIRERVSQFDVVSLGTMQRHQQTAEYCLGAMGLVFDQSSAQFDAGWNEYDHQNILGQYSAELLTAASTEAYIKAQSNPLKAFEETFNGAVQRWINSATAEGYSESWCDYTGRIQAALNAVIGNNPGAKNIAVFTSGGPISLLSQALLGVPEENIMQLNWTLVNCGVTKLVASRARTFVATLNDHVHFEGEHKHFITYK